MPREAKKFLRVIVPIHNGGTRFAETMYKALCKQTFQDFHLVCVDDCSTDDTYEVLKKLKRVNSIIRNERQLYCGGSRNAGMAKFKSDTYTFFVDDDDDLFDEFVFQRIFDAAEENDYPDMIRMQYAVYDIVKGERKFSALNRSFLIKNTSQKVCEDLAGGAPWTKAIKTEKLVRFPEGTNLDDCCQHIAQSDITETLAIVPEPCYIRLRRSDSVSVTRKLDDRFVLLAMLLRLQPTLKHDWAVDVCKHYYRLEFDLIR